MRRHIGFFSSHTAAPFLSVMTLAPVAATALVMARYASTTEVAQRSKPTAALRSSALGRISTPKLKGGAERPALSTAKPAPVGAVTAPLPSEKKKSIARVSKRISPAKKRALSPQKTQAQPKRQPSPLPSPPPQRPEAAAQTVVVGEAMQGRSLPTYAHDPSATQPEGYNRSLAAKAPNLAGQYLLSNPQPANVMPSESPVLVDWQCNACNNVWKQAVFERTVLGSSCPKCTALLEPSLRQTDAKLALELHDTRNDPFLTPDSLTLGHRAPLWWRCGDCQHEFQATFRQRTKGGERACPSCSGRTNAATFKALALEWHPSKNGDLSAASAIRKDGPLSKRLLWWLCPRCAFEWQSPAAPRLRGYGACPQCHPHRSQTCGIPKGSKFELSSDDETTSSPDSDPKEADGEPSKP